MAAAGGQDSQVPRSSHVLTTFSVPLTIRSHCGQTSPAVPRLLSDNVPPLTNLLSITALQVRAQAQQHPSCLTAPTPHSPAVAQKPGGLGGLRGSAPFGSRAGEVLPVLVPRPEGQWALLHSSSGKGHRSPTLGTPVVLAVCSKTAACLGSRVKNQLSTDGWICFRFSFQLCLSVCLICTKPRCCESCSL